MKRNYNTADAEWEWYIGQLYYQLMRNLYKKELHCVVELAPGFRHKIADALKQYNFSGTLYVIDSSKDVLNYIKRKYKEKLPKATIICINQKFEDCIDVLPNNIDLFLSNHSIDDLIISNYVKGDYTKDINNEQLYKDLLKSWENLKKDKKKAQGITKELVNAFQKLFKRNKNSLIIMSQYKSNSYYLEKTNNMDIIVDNCFKKIKALTNTDDKKVNQLLDFYPFGVENERYNGKNLISNTQNAKHWIAGTIR